MRIQFLVAIFILSFGSTSAQVNDSARLPKRSFESSLFANDDTLTRNDYLLSISKVFQLLNKASTLSQPVPAITGMVQRMDEDDSAISIIKDRLTNNDRALNVRSLQTFTIILGKIKSNTKEYAKELNRDDSILDATKKNISDLRSDTVIRHIFRDSALKVSFTPQLHELRSKWKKADSLIKYVNALIDNTLAHTSDNLITTNELELQTQNLEETTGSRAFSKERRYLWESRRVR
ncbi:MAG: hypothetical protein ACRDE8_11275, partial [Ginsengibacter sp.]